MLVGVVMVLAYIFSLVRRNIPREGSENVLSAEISIDSIMTLGPTLAIYDKTLRQHFWLKSYTSFDVSKLDSLKSRKASIRYMKFLQGPLENRIVRMQVGQRVIIDQIVDK